MQHLSLKVLGMVGGIASEVLRHGPLAFRLTDQANLNPKKKKFDLVSTLAVFHHQAYT